MRIFRIIEAIVCVTIMIVLLASTKIVYPAKYILNTWTGAAIFYLIFSYWIFKVEKGVKAPFTAVLMGIGLSLPLVSWIPMLFNWPIDTLWIYQLGIVILLLVLLYEFVIVSREKKEKDNRKAFRRMIVKRILIIGIGTSILNVWGRNSIFPYLYSKYSLAAHIGNLMLTGKAERAKEIMESPFSKFSGKDFTNLYDPDISNRFRFQSKTLYGEILLSLGDTAGALNSFAEAYKNDTTDLMALFNVALLRNKQYVSGLKRKSFTGKTESFMPYELNDGFEISYPDSEAVSADIIRKHFNEGEKVERLISCLVLKNDKIVAERYYHYSPLHVQWTYSTWKSVVSLMTGIALDMKFIKSVDQKLPDFFNKDSYNLLPPRNEITLKHLLTMTSGITGADNGDYWISNDPAKQMLNEMVTGKPGDPFVYATQNMFMTKEIVAKSSKMSFETFCQTVCDTLNVINGYFPKNEFGKVIKQPVKWDGSYSTLRDMVKFGMILSDSGKYRGQQIVSNDWIKEMTKEQVHFENKIDGFTGYGYFIWLTNVNSHAVFMARGKGGQIVACVPDCNLIVATFGSEWDYRGGGEIEQFVFSLLSDVCK